MTGSDRERDVAAPTLTIEVIAHLWRQHANCTWVSTGVNVMWSCGIWHPGPIHMQPTTRDRHLAALVMTQVDADVAARTRSVEELAARDKAIAATALRDAARDLPGFESVRTHGDAARWLRARADIEEEVMDEALIHARWHRALDDPASEQPGPIRDHIEQHDKAVAAEAWDEGRRTGASRAMRHMSDEPDLPLATAADNPYRDLARCPVTVYAGAPAPGRHATRPCGEPVALWGLCTRHLADHARLCDGCGRCGR